MKCCQTIHLIANRGKFISHFILQIFCQVYVSNDREFQHLLYVF